MRVLLVRPERVGEFSAQGRHQIKHVPLGLLYLAGTLRTHRHDVRICDEIVGDDVALAIREFQPDLMGITCTTPLWDRVQKLVAIAKESGIKVVVGGPHVSALPELCLKEAPIDAAATGEGEETLVELCESRDWTQVKGVVLRDGNGGYLHTPTRPMPDDLDEIPFPAYDLVKREKYMGDDELGFYVRKNENLIRIFSSRGCPFLCTYCSSHNTFGRPLRIRSAQNVVEELRELTSLWKTKNVCFMDDIFTINQDRVREVCEAMRSADLKLRWSCFSRVGLTEPTVKEMAAAGCILIGFGVETGSAAVLKRIKKATTLDQARDTFRLLDKYGIRRKAFFMINFPGETRQEFEETVNFAIELNPDYVMLSIFIPLPGSELFDGVNPADYAHHTTKSFFHTSDPETRARQLEFLQRYHFRMGYVKTMMKNFSPRHLPYYLNLFRHYLAVRAAS
ncbi:MAG: radical SAM protein [Acidobacteriota bacterium]